MSGGQLCPEQADGSIVPDVWCIRKHGIFRVVFWA